MSFSGERHSSQKILSSLNLELKNRLIRLAGLDENNKLSPIDSIAVAVLLEGGGSILKSPKVVREILCELPNLELRELSNKHCQKVYEKPFDNAIALSNLNEAKLRVILRAVLDRQSTSLLKGMGIDVGESTAETVYSAATAKKLLPHQEMVMRSAIELVKSGGNFLIQMPTGAGKTTTAIVTLILSKLVQHMIADGKLGFWVAPTRELVEQAATAFKSLWSYYGDSVVRMYVVGQFNESDFPPDGTIVFTTYHQIAALETSGKIESYQKRCSFLIADEAHRSIAPTYRSSISLLTEGAVRIGLTATPGRTANLSKENLGLSTFFDSRIVRATDSKNEIYDLQENEVLSQIEHTIIQIKSSGLISQRIVKSNVSSLSSVESSLEKNELKTLRELALNDGRNAIILETIQDRVASGHRVIFFGCGVDHSRLLSAALIAKGIPAASIDASTSTSVRDTVIQRYKDGKIRVIGNFSVLTTGFDAPGTDVVLITRPTSSIVSYSQMVGRALRGPKMGGQKTAEVIEFSDAIDLSICSAEIYEFFDSYWHS